MGGEHALISQSSDRQKKHQFTAAATRRARVRMDEPGRYPNDLPGPRTSTHQGSARLGRARLGRATGCSAGFGAAGTRCARLGRATCCPAGRRSARHRRATGCSTSARCTSSGAAAGSLATGTSAAVDGFIGHRRTGARRAHGLRAGTGGKGHPAHNSEKTGQFCSFHEISPSEIDADDRSPDPSRIIGRPEAHGNNHAGVFGKSRATGSIVMASARVPIAWVRCGDRTGYRRGTIAFAIRRTPSRSAVAALRDPVDRGPHPVVRSALSAAFVPLIRLRI